jgi:Holliday junction resolvasome RuvABC DNA-binding subunit
MGTTPPIDGIPLLTVQVQDIAPPDHPTDLPREHLTSYYRDCVTELQHMGVAKWVAQLIAGLVVAPAAAVVVVKDVLIVVLRVVLPTWGGEVLAALDDLRKALDSEFAQLAVDVLNELLGTNITPGNIATGSSTGDHLARADTVGGILHDVLLSEFQNPQTGTPGSTQVDAATGRAAARRFSGLMINFGTATGVLATLGGLVPAIHLDDIREIGEAVAQNLGLGRLGRQVLKPIVEVLMTQPYTWWVHQNYRPTQFTAGDVVNPFSGAVMPANIVHDSLANAGYSDDKITALIELHQKKLNEADAFLLYSQPNSSESDFVTALEKLGYSESDAEVQKHVMLLREEAALEKQILEAAMSSYTQGHITRDELQQVVNTAIALPDLQPLYMTLADYKRKIPTKHLTIAELTTMLEENIMTTNAVSDYLSNLGYNSTDAFNLLQVILAKVQTAEAKAKAAAAKAAAEAATSTTPPATT